MLKRRGVRRGVKIINMNMKKCENLKIEIALSVSDGERHGERHILLLFSDKLTFQDFVDYMETRSELISSRLAF